MARGKARLKRHRQKCERENDQQDPSRRVDVAGVANGLFQQLRDDGDAIFSGANRRRIRHNPAHGPIEAPLRRKLAASRGKQSDMRGVEAVLERSERLSGRELGAAQREAKAVAGDGIDKAGRIAREQEAWRAGRAGVDGERPKANRRGHHSRIRQTARRSCGSRLSVSIAAAHRDAAPTGFGVTMQALVTCFGSGATPM